MINSLKLNILMLFLVVYSNLFADVQFTNRTEDQPFQHQYTGGWEHYVGGGVATFDCNDDNYPDLYVAGGESPAKLLINESHRFKGKTIRFSHKQHEDTDLKSVTGAYPLDIDSDGILDLVVLRVGENVLLKGKGNCAFARANELWGFDGENKWTTAFSATWEEGRKGPTLAFGNYVNRKKKDNPFGACNTNSMVRFSDNKFEKAIILEPGFCTLSILFSDWKHNGRADLRVSNDRHYYAKKGEEQLWKMQETPTLYTQQEGWKSFQIWGMGIASRDITGDGFPDYLLTSMSDQKFQTLDDKPISPIYKDEAFKRGITAHRPYFGDNAKPSTAWHAEFGDVNNDGFDDLFIAKGNVEKMAGAAMKDPNNLLMQDKLGKFIERGKQAGIADTEKSRGATLSDLNHDGKLDLVVVNRGADMQIYENETLGVGNWVSIQLQQKGTNTRAVGAWIELVANGKTYHREITVGGGHASGSAVASHFGVGVAKQVKYRVTWPDGEKSIWQSAKLNQAIVFERK